MSVETDLQAALDAIQTAIGGIGTRIDGLVKQIADLQANQPVRYLANPPAPPRPLSDWPDHRA